MPGLNLGMRIKIDDAWLKVNVDDPYGMPICMVCLRPLRKGSYVDHHWPYLCGQNVHVKCLRAE